MDGSFPRETVANDFILLFDLAAVQRKKTVSDCVTDDLQCGFFAMTYPWENILPETMRINFCINFKKLPINFSVFLYLAQGLLNTRAISYP